jgi:hypothetical protein
MIAFRFRENCAGQHVPSEKGAASLHAGRPVFGIGFQGRSIVRVPLKPHLGVSCIWRLLNFAVWPGRKPFGGAENSSIGFICELKKQVRLCPVLFGEGQSAISDRARIAHGASQIPTPAHTAGTGLKPAAYGLNAHLELQVLNGGARNRRRPCGGGDQPAFRSPPAKPAPATIWMRTQRQSGWPFRRSRRRDDCPTITQATREFDCRGATIRTSL